MNFLIDAQLPRRLAFRLREHGHDALHTLDLPDGNRTTDAAIIAHADQEDRVVITKDADFVNAFLLSGKPRRLLVIATGNIRNSDLEAIVVPNLPAIITALASHTYLELTTTALIVHQ